MKEAGKPPLEKPTPVTKPFGFDNRVTLNSDAINITNIFSKEASERRQAQLDHDIKHSPFYESKSFANTQGKIFSPPISYFRGDRALYFPNFIGYPLNNHKLDLYSLLEGKTTILRIFSTISGENCTNTYVEQYLDSEGYKEFRESYPHAQIVDVNIPQSWIKGLFVKLAKSNLRKIIPEDRHDKYFIVSDKIFPVSVKRTLKCDNSCSGYLYVIDKDCKIRWATSGMATEEESKTLWMTVRGLEKEIRDA